MRLVAHVYYCIYQDLCRNVCDGNDGLEPSHKWCTVTDLKSRHLRIESIVYIRKYTANIVQSQQNTKYNNYNNTEQQILTLSLYHV